MSKARIKKKAFDIITLLVTITVVFFSGFYCTNYFLNRLNPASKNVKVTAVINNNKKTDLNKEKEEQEKQKKETQIKANNQPIYPKEVFLTLDDGPSIFTQKIINILNDNNVKATFFLIGKNVDKYPDFAKLEVENGMCILPHSYTHDYNIVYKSVDAFFEDLQLCVNSMTKATGESNFGYLRFPGGSDNQVSFGNMKSIRAAVMQKGYKYVDWNVSSADAAPYHVEAERIKQNVISQCKEHNFAVVLMHDAPDKETTVEALPEIIRELKNEGFVFRTFNDLSQQEIQKMIDIKVMDR